MSFGKRLFDLCWSAMGLLLLWPIGLAVAIAIWIDDHGPVLFLQERVGENGRPFRMLKFRTMVIDAERRGGQLTVGADRRITRVGKWLRASKVDELPQLVNVLVGDMSLVGPRPEVRRYVDLYSPEQRHVLALVPGITDPASLAFRKESEILAASPDPEGTYVSEIMPTKIALNLNYAQRATVFTDFLVILQTIVAVVRD